MAATSSRSQLSRRNSEVGLGALIGGKFTDAHVECDGRTWAVHRVIVCNRSNWFDKAFGGGMKEAAEKKVTIHGMPSAHVDWLLRYIYGGDGMLEDTGHLSMNPFVAYCVAHRLGDYFDMDDLCTAAIMSIHRNLNSAIRFFQSGKDQISEEYFRAEVGVSRALFYEEFFEGVGMADGMEYENAESLRKSFDEFVTRTQYLVLECHIFHAFLDTNEAFAARILRLLSGEFRSGTMPLVRIFPTACSKCRQLKDDMSGHFAQVTDKTSGARRERYLKGTCSDCFQQEDI
ncbi:uncharacterized protein PG986_000757 [Apiospora aurea]|uniref:BTB domain-containing protein n=1 Tax=Apiospora aurea TaxID=335848 RepID=A0ABR1QWL0_9PEZI